MTTFDDRVFAIERVITEAMWERAEANAGAREEAPSATDIAKRIVAVHDRELWAFLEHLHDTGALSCPPSETWVDAFLEAR